MPSESELNDQMSAALAARTKLLTEGSGLDHSEGQLTVNRSNMLKALNETIRDLQKQLGQIPARKVRQQDTRTNRMGSSDDVFRGDVNS